jgi:hypothetical protein
VACGCRRGCTCVPVCGRSLFEVDGPMCGTRGSPVCCAQATCAGTEPLGRSAVHPGFDMWDKAAPSEVVGGAPTPDTEGTAPAGAMHPGTGSSGGGYSLGGDGSDGGASGVACRRVDPSDRAAAQPNHPRRGGLCGGRHRGWAGHGGGGGGRGMSTAGPSGSRVKSVTCRVCC